MIDWLRIEFDELQPGEKRMHRASVIGWSARRRLMIAVVIFGGMMPGAPRVLPADARLPALFCDHMVVQRGCPIPVWGHAKPAERVTVSFRGETIATLADADARWRVTFDAMDAGGPFELVIRAKNELRVRDVHVGDVWVCSGQSNMQWPVQRSRDAQREIGTAYEPRIRLFSVPHRATAKPQRDVRGKWQACTPETVAPFSAVAYFFGRALVASAGCTIGLIHTSWGGTSANLFNGMVAPLIPYAIRGVIWYQGEANASRAYQYRTLFSTMIRDWRAAWGQGDFPFLFVQLANFRARKTEPAESDWAELREAQAMALALPSTGMATAIDIGEAGDIHPRNKQDVGARLALAARAIAYGESVTYRGPMLRTSRRTDGAMLLSFDDAAGLTLRGETGKSFQVAGADRRWCWASVARHGTLSDTLVVSSPDVPSPVAVRYAWADNPAICLFNGAGLPAPPFRTDRWPGVTQ